MTTTMQHGHRVHRWGEAPVWEEMPRPAVGDGEVVVEVEACGVGLTVLNCINGDLGDDSSLLPRVPGHEFVGRVVEIGAGAPPELAGRRVAAYFYLYCGSCLECVSGRQPRCENLAGFMGVHRDGGYAPYATLPARNAVVLPDDLDPVAATVVPDAVATPVHVASRAAITPRDRVVVIGAGGGVGAHMLQVALLHGASVAGFEVTEQKLTLVEELRGIPVDSSDLSSVDGASLWDEGPPNVVVDLVGSGETLAWALANLGVGGRLAVLTTFRGRGVELDPRELVLREVSVIGSRYASVAEVSFAAQMVADGRIRPIVGETTGPDDVLRLHDLLRSDALIGRGALSWK